MDRNELMEIMEKGEMKGNTPAKMARAAAWFASANQAIQNKDNVLPILIEECCELLEALQENPPELEPALLEESSHVLIMTMQAAASYTKSTETITYAMELACRKEPEKEMPINAQLLTCAKTACKVMRQSDQHTDTKALRKLKQELAKTAQAVTAHYVQTIKHMENPRLKGNVNELIQAAFIKMTQSEKAMRAQAGKMGITLRPWP